jgi:hypothetical protein
LRRLARLLVTEQLDLDKFTVVIARIDIWRVAVLMVNRYPDAAETKADRCADDLETEGDHTGAAIWRRVTVAIERLTDTTGPPH